MPGSISSLRCAYILGALMTLCSCALGGDVYFSGPANGGSFHDIANWKESVDGELIPLGELPSWDDTALIGSLKTPHAQRAIFDEPVKLETRTMFVGYRPGGRGELVIDDPTGRLSTQQIIVGWGETGSLTVRQGLLAVELRETSYVGLQSGGDGKLRVEAGGTFACTPGQAGNEIRLGSNQATGLVEILGGTFDAAGCQLILGSGSGQGGLSVESDSEVVLGQITAAGQGEFSLAIRDGAFDPIEVRGLLSLSSLAKLNVHFVGEHPKVGDEFVLFRYGSLAGEFLPENIAVDGAGAVLDFGPGLAGSISLRVVHVPEPATLIVLLLGCLAIVLTKRRRSV